MKNSVGKSVILISAGNPLHVGRIIDYYEEPTYVVRLPGDVTIRWRASLCKIVSDEEAIVTAIFSGEFDDIAIKELRKMFPGSERQKVV